MNEQAWKDKFEELEVFIKETGKRPTKKSNRKLKNWIIYNTSGRYENSERSKKISKLFDKYGCRKNKHQSFNDTLNELNEFLKETGRKPTDAKNSRLYNWVWLNTIGRYKTIERANKINELFEKYELTDTTNRYEQNFNDNLNYLNDFIKETGKIPTEKSNLKLYNWILYYTSGRYENSDRAMLINDLFEKYELTSYRKNKEQSYNDGFNDLNDFLKEAGRKPTQKTNHKLYCWIRRNTTGRHKNSERSKKISKLFDKYGLTFPPIKKTPSFNDTLNELNDFIKETGKKPTKKSDRKLYNWICYNTLGRYENSDRAKMINDLFEKHGLK
nr:hypothetical protein [Moritella viscosa]SHO14697.1 Putative helicase [Moritella viscosa]